MMKSFSQYLLYGFLLLLFLSGCYGGSTGSRGNLGMMNSEGDDSSTTYNGTTQNQDVVSYDSGACFSVVSPAIAYSNQTFSVNVTVYAGTAPYTLISNNSSFTATNSTTFYQTLTNASSVNQLQTQSIYYKDSAGLVGVCNYSVTVAPCATGSCSNSVPPSGGTSQMTGCSLEMSPASVLNGKLTRARIHPQGTTAGYLIASITGPSYFRDVAVAPAVGGSDSATRVDHMVKFLRPGSYQVTASLTDYNSSDRKMVQCSSNVTVVPDSWFAAGQELGSQVAVYKGMAAQPLVNLSPYSDLAASWDSSARVAMGDVNADGVPDLIVAAAPGGSPRVRIFNGSNFTLMKEIIPFSGVGNRFIAVAAGDVNGDGYSDIVVSNDTKVQIYSGYDYSLLRSFISTFPIFAISTGDYEGDGRSDVAISSSGSTQFRVYSASSIMANSTAGALLTPWLDSYSTTNGTVPVNISNGDINGDGFVEIAFGTNASTIPKARIFNSSPSFYYSLLADLVPFVTSGGTPISGTNWVSFADVNGDGFDDLMMAGDGTMLSSGEGAEIKVFSGQNSFVTQLIGPTSTGNLRLFPFGNTYPGRLNLSVGR